MRFSPKERIQKAWAFFLSLVIVCTMVAPLFSPLAYAADLASKETSASIETSASPKDPHVNQPKDPNPSPDAKKDPAPKPLPKPPGQQGRPSKTPIFSILHPMDFATSFSSRGDLEGASVWKEDGYPGNLNDNNLSKTGRRGYLRLTAENATPHTVEGSMFITTPVGAVVPSLNSVYVLGSDLTTNAFFEPAVHISYTTDPAGPNSNSWTVYVDGDPAVGASAFKLTFASPLPAYSRIDFILAYDLPSICGDNTTLRSYGVFNTWYSFEGGLVLPFRTNYAGFISKRAACAINYYSQTTSGRTFLGTVDIEAVPGEHLTLPAGTDAGELNYLKPPLGGFTDGVQQQPVPYPVHDSDSNSIDVVYHQQSSLTYTVEYYKDDTSDANYLGESQPVGNFFCGEAIVLPGGTHNGQLDMYKPSEGYKSGKQVQPVPYIMVDEPNVIKVVYPRKDDLAYTVYYYRGEEGPGNLIGKKTFTNQTYGAKITLSKSVLDAYKLGSDYRGGIQQGEVPYTVVDRSNRITVIYPANMKPRIEATSIFYVRQGSTLSKAQLLSALNATASDPEDGQIPTGNIKMYGYEGVNFQKCNFPGLPYLIKLQVADSDGALSPHRTISIFVLSDEEAVHPIDANTIAEKGLSPAPSGYIWAQDDYGIPVLVEATTKLVPASMKTWMLAAQNSPAASSPQGGPSVSTGDEAAGKRAIALIAGLASLALISALYPRRAKSDSKN